MSLLELPAAPPPPATTAQPAQEPARPAPAAWTRPQWAALLAVTALALWLRLHRLGDWSIWVDEAHTWRDVTLPLDVFWDSARAWYPLSYLALRGLLGLGALPDLSEASMRLPFALLGAASVPLLALVGRPLVGARASLLAAALLAVHPWHLYWSQNARAYALVVLLTIGAVGVYAHAVRTRRLGWHAAALLLVVVATASHPSGAALAAAFMVHTLLSLPGLAARRGVVAVAIMAIGLLCLPLVQGLPQFRTFQFAKPESSPSVLHVLQTAAWHFRVPLLLAAVLGAAFAVHAERARGRAGGLIVVAAFLVPLLLVGAIGIGLAKVTARYAITALPMGLLLAGLAGVRLSDAIRRGLPDAGSPALRRLAAIGLPALLAADLVSGCYLYFGPHQGDRGPWRQAAVEVSARLFGQRACIMTTHEPCLLYGLRPGHYEGSADPRVEVLSLELSEAERGAGAEQGLLARQRMAQAAGRALWFVVCLPELREKDPDGAFVAALHRRCELVAVLPSWVGPRDQSIYLFAPR